jgi:hypothetical protein
MSPKSEEHEALTSMLLHRMNCLEAYIDTFFGPYNVMKGQAILDQRKIREEQRQQSIKERAEKAKELPRIRIVYISRGLTPGISVTYQKLGEFGSSTWMAEISLEAVEQLKKGTRTGFHMVRLNKSPTTVLALASELNQLPERYDARILSDVAVELEMADDAIAEKGFMKVGTE